MLKRRARGLRAARDWSRGNRGRATAVSVVGIVGHVETPTLCECASHAEAIDRLGELTLLEVQGLLSEAIARTRTADK